MSLAGDIVAGHTAKARGFTLLELLIVLAIVGLISAIALPRFRQALPGIELKTVARDLADSMRTARSEAIRTGREVTFLIETDEAVSSSGLGKIGWPLPKGFTLERRDSIAGGRQIRLRFFSDGSSDGGVMTLSRGELRIDVAVDWLTAAVRVTER